MAMTHNLPADTTPHKGSRAYKARPHDKRPALERDIEAYFTARCKEIGVLCYKYTSPQNAGVPDRIVVGVTPDGVALTIFVELKRPGSKTRILQDVEQANIRAHGGLVCTLDSREAIEEFFAHTFLRE